MLFFGLELMGSGMKPLRSLQQFHDLTVSMSDNPILGVVIGTLFTVIVQSSSATIGILQELLDRALLIYMPRCLYCLETTLVRLLPLF